uniref:Uncharacterized protein n=1 Tax=Trichogramma kaykai TaxID=54128 RepID=A0ABD2X3T3_9HYME
MAGTLGRAVYIMRAAICDVTACELSSMITLIHAYSAAMQRQKRENNVKCTPRLLYIRARYMHARNSRLEISHRRILKYVGTH